MRNKVCLCLFDGLQRSPLTKRNYVRGPVLLLLVQASPFDSHSVDYQGGEG